MTTVQAALTKDPELLLHVSRPPLPGRLMAWAHRLNMMQGRFPPGFRSTMGKPDTRLPEMAMGLGVIGILVRRFYPFERIKAGIEDEIDGERIRIFVDPLDSMPSAEYMDGSRPVQLFTRWYGFSSTFPGCEIYSP